VETNDNTEAEAKLPRFGDELRAELDRRLKEYLDDPDRVIRWEDVKARYEKRR
jgi:putative addiction module component (TIGR02574 family)